MTPEFTTLFWKLRGLGFDPCEAEFYAKFHTAVVRKMFEESEKRFEEKLAKRSGHCRACGAVTKGLKVFCPEHEFTVKTGFDSYTFDFDLNKGRVVK